MNHGGQLLRIKSTFKKHWFGVRIKFIVVISVILLLLFAIASTILLSNSHNSLTKNMNQSSKAFAELATSPIGDTFDVYQSYGSLHVTQQITKFLNLNSDIANIAIYNIYGSQVYALHRLPKFDVTQQMAASFNPVFVDNANGEIIQIVQPYLSSDGLHEYAIAYIFSAARINQAISQQATTIVLLLISALIITGAATFWLINILFLKPIAAISNDSLKISQGQYDKQVESERNDEIGVLAASVNTMANHLKNDIFELKEVDSLKNEFIMITSHNLRTPLTIMEGNMEIVRSIKLPTELQSVFSDIEVGLKRLESFSEDILTIASIEAGSTEMANRPTTIDDLLRDIEKTYRAAADKKHISLHWQSGNFDTKLLISKTHLRSILRNLLDNAIKFTNEGGNVWFRQSLDNSDLIIEVKDDGIGIAPEEMNKLFQKFHRGTDTYRYDYEGTGIGLYATKLITQAYGGKVTATSTLGIGSTFTVRIPSVLSRSSTTSKPVQSIDAGDIHRS